jgi:galactokinase
VTVIARAPGRVNLIGDHTDYTGGYCLPIAIDRWVEVTVRPDPTSRTVRLHSESLGSTVTVPLEATDPGAIEPEWGRYVAAVVKRLRPATGCTGDVRSTVPIGSGLSSSAALEVATALALAGEPPDRVAIAELCRDAEHEARGVPTGMLDQLASLFGVAGHALLIDCATNALQPVSLPGAAEAELVVVDTGERSLASSGYAARVEECRRAEIQIGPLRAATERDVEQLADAVLRRRARHVVSENGRVHHFAAALAAGDVLAAGRLMDDSHRSLSEDYESSTPAVDQLCAELRRRPDVLGVRITGGGWGGCVIALTRPGALAGRGWSVRAVDAASVEIRGGVAPGQ